MAVTLVENGDWQEVSRASGSYGAATLTCVVYAKCHDRQIDNNRHYVEVKQVTYVVNSLSGSGYQFDATLCGSQSGSSVWTFENGEVVNSGGGWIGHNDDGTKSMWIGAYAYNKYWGVSLSYGDTVILPTIPRASTPSITSASTAKDLGSNIAISISRASSSFKHTINIKDGSTIVETLGNKNIDTSTTWTPSTATYAPLITNGDTKTFTIECLTFNGNTQIGSKTCTAILKVLDSTIPSVSIALAEADSTMVSKNWGVYVQGKSKLAVTLTATKAYNANISSYSSSVDGVPYTGSSYTTPVLTKSGAQTATATVTDTRNHTSDQASKSYTVVEYNRPSIATALCERCNSDGTPNDEGTSLKYTFKASISPVLNGSTPKNTKSFKIYYKTKSASSYTQLADVTPSGSTAASYTLNKELQVISSVTFSASTTYNIKFEVTDGFETLSIEREIGTGFDLMNFNASGKSMAIGKMSEAGTNDTKLEIALDTDFSSIPTVNGNPIGAADVPVGTVLPYTSTSVPSGYLLCDGSAISRTTYAQLFAVIGTTYGSGDGSTTFNLPNLQGRFVLGKSGSYALASTGGAATVTLTTDQIPSHTHTQKSCTNPGDHAHNTWNTFSFRHASGGVTTTCTGDSGDGRGNATQGAGGHTHTITLNDTGGGQAHNNMPPYITLVYMIKVENGNATVPGSVIVTNADVAQITQNKNDITSLKTRATTLENRDKYSTSEKVIGEWIDGKPLYRKTISFGALPNAGTKTVAHGISNLKRVVHMYGYSFRSSDNVHFPLPFVSTTAINCILLDVIASNISITTGINRTTQTENYITLEYTKTTD